MRDLRFRARKQDQFPKDSLIDIVLFATDGETILAPKMEFHPVDGREVESLAHLSIPTAQQLFDDLWEAGLRPSKAQNNVGVIAAKDAHITHLFELAKGLLSRPQ